MDAEAREPGIALSYPPGPTLGLPIAVPLKPGGYVASRSTYQNVSAIDNNGQAIGQYLDAFGEALQFTWVPEGKILEGTFRMFLLQPFVDLTQTRTYPMPPAARGKANQFGLANLKFQFFNLSWSLGDGFYAATGISVYFPTGQWAPNAVVNIGANFWTFEPSVAFTYFKDGWNASVHAVYDTNTRNPQNQYYSGDMLVLNGIVTKNLAGFDIGPVGYYAKQVTSDSNLGGPTVFGGTNALPPELYAIGGIVGRQLDKFYVQFMYTQDVYARNAYIGGKAWIGITFKMY